MFRAKGGLVHSLSLFPPIKKGKGKITSKVLTLLNWSCARLCPHHRFHNLCPDMKNTFLTEFSANVRIVKKILKNVWNYFYTSLNQHSVYKFNRFLTVMTFIGFHLLKILGRFVVRSLGKHLVYIYFFLFKSIRI